MRTAAKRDANEREIIDALKKIGCSVVQVSQEGLPDLSVGFRARNFWLECKSKGGKLTPAQEKFFASWRGQVRQVTSVDEALELVTEAYR